MIEATKETAPRTLHPLKGRVRLIFLTLNFTVAAGLIAFWQLLPDHSLDGTGDRPKIIAVLGRPFDIAEALPEVASQFYVDIIFAVALTAVGLFFCAFLAISVVAVDWWWPSLRPLMRAGVLLPQVIPFFWLMILSFTVGHTLLVMWGVPADRVSRWDPVLLIPGIVLTTAFPAIVACIRASQEVNSELLAMIDSWQLSKREIFTRVLWPHLLTGALSGLSAAAPWALSAFFFAASTLPELSLPTVKFGKLVVGVKGNYPVEYITAAIVWATFANVLLYNSVRWTYRRISRRYFGELFAEEMPG